MYIAMNRFNVNDGFEVEFENVWRERDSKLEEVPGFVEFHLLKGAKDDKANITLYSSHTLWASKEHFIAWTKSEHFRAAHKNAGNNGHIYAGHPNFEGFDFVEGV